MSLYFAYDGSINGDWVARYAISLAAGAPERRLHLVYVETGEPGEDRIGAKLDRLEAECSFAGVALRVERTPMRRSVFTTLAEVVPAGAEVSLICGTRARSGRRGYLSGSHAERLLRNHRSNVLAVRVVQPGLLGAPHDVLLPVLGAPGGLRPGIALLAMMAERVRHLQIVRMVRVGRGRLRRLPVRRLAALRRDGLDSGREIERQVIAQSGLDERCIDAGVRVGDDWVHDVVVQANRHKSQLICVQALILALRERVLFANPVERLLRDAPCDVVLFRGA